MSQNNPDNIRPADLVDNTGQTNDPIPDNLKADEHANDEAVLAKNDAKAEQATEQKTEQTTNTDKPTSPKKGGSGNTLLVALVLCLVCSVMVSAAAISMKPKQLANVELDRNKNILMAANLFDPEKDSPDTVAKRFENVQIRLIDTKTGQFATDDMLKADNISDVGAYDVVKASKDVGSRIVLDSDPAQVGALPKYLKVYIINDNTGNLKNVVLPINGNGLWGQIYGFLTLKSDINTIEGISFYQHKETPGLGALIETPKWRANWVGKQAYDGDKIITGVVKSGSPKPNPNYVDGITGATLTSAGVNNMIQFWLSDQAYKPFLDNLKANPTMGKEQ